MIHLSSLDILPVVHSIYVALYDREPVAVTLSDGCEMGQVQWRNGTIHVEGVKFEIQREGGLDLALAQLGIVDTFRSIYAESRFR